MMQTSTALWAHGYGMHPGTDRLLQAGQQVAGEIGIPLETPALSDLHDDGRLVVLPIQEQADRLVTYLNGVDASPDVIVTHSQGIWAVAMALDDMGANNGDRPQLVSLAPALNNPRARLEQGLDDPTPEDHAAAALHGGAYGALRLRSRDGRERSIVISEDYWSEMEELGDEALLELSAKALLAHSPDARVIRPQEDDRFGDLSTEYDELARLAEEQGVEIPVEDVPDTGHLFKGKELLVARAALGGWSVESSAEYAAKVS